jgi:hypothetical protein
MRPGRGSVCMASMIEARAAGIGPATAGIGPAAAVIRCRHVSSRLPLLESTLDAFGWAHSGERRLFQVHPRPTVREAEIAED